MKLFFLLFLFVSSYLKICHASSKLQRIVDYVNSANTTWQAGLNSFHTNDYKKLVGTLHFSGAKFEENRKEPVYEVNHEDDNANYPEFFDARYHWFECPSISHIWNQGNCAADWAISVASVINDRLCIASKGNITALYSPQKIVSCCDTCGNGCNGGYTAAAFDYIHKRGIVTGGDYGSEEAKTLYPEVLVPLVQCNQSIDSSIERCVKVTDVGLNVEGVEEINFNFETDKIHCSDTFVVNKPKEIGCQPWLVAPCNGTKDHADGAMGPRPWCSDQAPTTPKCDLSCYNSKYEKSYLDDIVKSTKRYTILGHPARKMLKHHGPYVAMMRVYEDFLTYKSGVYQHVTGDYLGMLSVRIIGWGMLRGQVYWLFANSWGTAWGDKGFFKIRSYVNECWIEDIKYGADPIL